MQSLVFLTYFYQKLSKKNLWKGWLDPHPALVQEGLIISRKGICGTFDRKPNHFGPAVPKKLKKIETWDKKVIK